MIFLIYLALVGVVMLAAWHSKSIEFMDLAGILFVSWIAANTIIYAADTFAGSMFVAHLLLLLATFMVYRGRKSQWAFFIMLLYIPMIANHFRPDVHSYSYHALQNGLYAAQCLICLAGSLFCLAKKQKNKGKKGLGGWQMTQHYKR